ncbi:MAG: TonB-dependent receptor [Bacteroidia bacterium]|nr:TonB-dependent receptor [Bacteroidia bacterium]
MKTIKLAIIGLLNTISCISFAQSTDTLKSVTLKEVVVSVNKEEETRKTVAQEVQVLTSKEIQNAEAATTAEVISNAGIPVQKSQLGGGSPILRGFETSRILLMIDGVRLNNLIYRDGHLQDIIKTDNSILDRVEILYGPASTIYGSDALGGVILLYTKKPLFSMDDKANIKVNVLSRYESAYSGLTEHLDFNYGGKKVASLTSFSYSKFGDLMTGKNQNPFYGSEYGTRPYYVKYLGNGRDSLMKNGDRYLMVGSGYSQYDVMQKISFRQSDHLTHSLNIQYSTTGDVPRFDRMTDPSTSTGLKYADYHYGPQTRMLAAYDVNLNNPEGKFDGIHLGLNYQMLEESRHDRKFNSASLNHRIEKVNIIGVNLDFLKKIKEQHDIRFGADMQLNALKSTANKEDIVTGTTGKLDTRYPDGDNIMNSFGLYFSHTWKINEQLAMVDGLRAGYTRLHSTLVDTALLFHLPYTEIGLKTPVYSGNIGIINSPSDDLKLSFLISTGFRVPNVDDMTKLFGSYPGMAMVPNPDLKPEKTINYEIGITKIFNNKTRWETSMYYTDYRDIVTVADYKYNGQDSIFYDGTMSKVFAMQNKKHAYIYGFTSNILSNLDEHFIWSLGVDYTYGRIKTDTIDYQLDHIPPFMARTSFKYKNHKFSSDIFIIYSGWKRLKDYNLTGEDNLKYATADGMPAWFTLNLRVSYQVHKFVALQAGVDNIFDTQYRTFASGINGPGRNFIVALRGTF